MGFTEFYTNSIESRSFHSSFTAHAISKLKLLANKVPLPSFNILKDVVMISCQSFASLRRVNHILFFWPSLRQNGHNIFACICLSSSLSLWIKFRILKQKWTTKLFNVNFALKHDGLLAQTTKWNAKENEALKNGANWK